jgi:hypothetical protein
LEQVQRNLLPAYERAHGLDSVHLLYRSLVAYDELVTVSLWLSEEALAQFTASCDLQECSPELSGIKFEPRTYTLVLSRNVQSPPAGAAGEQLFET